jgi:ABC-type sugar transport system permease subunit
MNLWVEIRKYKHCYLWIAPFFILFAVFSLYPTIYGFKISLTDYNGFDAAKFVGFENYSSVFSDPLFWQSLLNTFVLWLLIVPLRTVFALILASILNSSRIIGRRLYSSIVLLPYVTAIVVVAGVFRMLFATESGTVNVILNNWFGIGSIGWLDTTQLSKISIAIMNIWRMTGYFSLIMLAGMQKISVSVNEAAEMDGAGPMQKFIRITIPLMVHEIFFAVLISTIWVFQNVADVMVLTGGGPLNSSTTLVYYIYRNAYEFFKMGYASALSYILFGILIALSWFSVKGYYRKWEE